MRRRVAVAAGCGDVGLRLRRTGRRRTIYQDDGEVFMSRAKPNSSMMQNISRTRPSLQTVGLAIVASLQLRQSLS